MSNKHIGSTLDGLLEELGESEEVDILARKKMLARQIEEVREARKISVSEMARRMKTSRMAVHSLLHPTKPMMTIDSVARAAAAVGARFETRVIMRAAPVRHKTVSKASKR